VAYFEVAIGPPSDATSSTLDCIAVCLGSSAFPLLGRQPGWDGHSYGYHSDDGRLFHGSGTRSYAFGPRFGVGDTVGCGLCLRTRRIFYTLNGTFLGVAFVARQSQLPLYPVVGLDTRDVVHFNFGMRPFAFDLHTLHAQLSDRPKTADASAFGALRSLALAFSRSSP